LTFIEVRLIYLLQGSNILSNAMVTIQDKLEKYKRPFKIILYLIVVAWMFYDIRSNLPFLVLLVPYTLYIIHLYLFRPKKYTIDEKQLRIGKNVTIPLKNIQSAVISLREGWYLTESYIYVVDQFGRHEQFSLINTPESFNKLEDDLIKYKVVYIRYYPDSHNLAEAYED